MRPTAIVSEAWANLRTGTTRAATLAAVLILTAGTLAVLDARAMVGVLSAAEQFRSAGGATWILEDKGNVDGPHCDALNGADGMRVGALREGDPTRALALPASQLTTWEASPGLLGAALGRDVPTDPGVWVSADLAEALGLAPGDVLATSSGDALVAGTYSWPEDGRARTLGYSLVVPVAATGNFDACWAATWPPSQDSASLLYSAAGSKADAQPTLTQLNPSSGTSYDPRSAMASRLTRWTPAAAAVIGLVVGLAGVRARRLQIASALHARVARPHLAWQHLLEATCWVGAATLVAGAASAWAAAAGNPDPSAAVYLTALRTVGAGAAGAIAGTLAAVSTARERDLFRYFRDR
ncbi:hypothetical protein [Cellulomonas sp. URHB0016]